MEKQREVLEDMTEAVFLGCSPSKLHCPGNEHVKLRCRALLEHVATYICLSTPSRAVRCQMCQRGPTAGALLVTCQLLPSCSL